MEDTDKLLHLPVNVINSGLHEANESLNKHNIERVIFYRLNTKNYFPYNL